MPVKDGGRRGLMNLVLGPLEEAEVGKEKGGQKSKPRKSGTAHDRGATLTCLNCFFFWCFKKPNRFGDDGSCRLKEFQPCSHESDKTCSFKSERSIWLSDEFVHRGSVVA